MFLFVLRINAQQDPIYSQLSFNILQFNPGYAGSRDNISGIATYRTQWTKVDGHPKTFNVGLHSPVNNHFGVGINATYDQIGVSKNLFSNLMLSYRVTLKESFIQFGLQGGIENYNNNYSEIQTTTALDPTFTENQNSTFFNFGAGAYYSSKKLYLGLSVPTILSHQNYFQNNGSEEKRYSHLYGLVGYIKKINDDFVLRPSVVMRWSSGTTLFADLNATVIWDDLIWLGLSYKTTNVMAAMIQLHLKGNIYTGYSYDFALSSNSTISSPTHEIILGIDIPNSQKRFASPRYF